MCLEAQINTLKISTIPKLRFSEYLGVIHKPSGLQKVKLIILRIALFLIFRKQNLLKFAKILLKSTF